MFTQVLVTFMMYVYVYVGISRNRQKEQKSKVAEVTNVTPKSPRYNVKRHIPSKINKAVSLHVYYMVCICVGMRVCIYAQHIKQEKSVSIKSHGLSMHMINKTTWAKT